MTRRRTLAARRRIDLAPHLEGFAAPTAFAVDPEGFTCASRRSTKEALRVDRGLGSFPKTTLENATDWLVLRWEESGITKTIVKDETMVISYVQPLGDDFLLVSARCHWRPPEDGGPEKNAVVVDRAGEKKRAFTIGDGVNDVRVAPNGTIWASYFDEGVFGNYGWNSPGPSPIGAAGLVAFDVRGRVVARFDAQAAGTDAICDAYALDVDRDGAAWVYFYMDFPIVRFAPTDAGSPYRAWHLDDVEGARAMAVRGDRALLVGGYGTRDIARVVALKRTRGEVVEEVLLRDEEGAKLDGLSYGAAERVYFLRDREVLVLDAW